MNEIKNITDLTQEQIDKNFADVVGRGSLDEISFYANFVKDAKSPDRFGLDPVRLALANPLNSEDKYKIMKVVLRAGADVNVMDREGHVPAMEAFRKNYRGIGLLLMAQKNANVSAVDSDGDGLLNYATRTGSANVVYKAIKMRVPYFVNKKGEGALSIAVQENNMPLIDSIIQGLWGCRQNPRHLPDFKKAWQFAKDNDNKEVLSALVRKKEEGYSLDLSTARDRVLAGLIKHAETEAEFEARCRRLPKEERNLIEYLVPVTGEPITERLNKALFEQIKSGTAHNVAVLLAVGADPNCKDKFGQTPLLVAIGSSLKGSDISNNKNALPESTPYDKAEWLIRYGADIWEECHARTPFLWAFSKNRPGIAALLLSALPSKRRSEMVRKKNKAEDGPLKYAAGCSSPNGIKFILENGGDIDERGSLKKRAMYWAVEAGKPDNIMALWDGGFKLELDSAEGREILQMLNKRRYTWDIPDKYDETGERIVLSEAEKETFRNGVYKNVVKALHKEYVSEHIEEKKVKKTANIGVSLEQKLKALDKEQADLLEGLMSMSILPQDKRVVDTTVAENVQRGVLSEEEMPEGKPVSEKSLWQRICERRKEVRAQKKAKKETQKRQIVTSGGR